MKKVQVNYFKFYVILFIIFIAVEILFTMPDINWPNLYVPFALCLLIAIPLEIFERYRKSGVYMSSEGIHWRIGDKIIFKKWDEIKVQKKIDFKYIKYLTLNISNGEKNLDLALFWPTEKNISILAQEFIPREHDLCIIIKDYLEGSGLEISIIK